MIPDRAPIVERHGERVEVDQEVARTAIGGDLVVPPEGWRIAKTYIGDYVLGFASTLGETGRWALSGADYGPDGAPIPVIDEITLTRCYLEMDKADERLDVSLTPVRTELARVWQAFVARVGTLEPFGIGEGFTSGETAVIFGDDQVVIVTYFAQNPSGATPEMNRATTIEAVSSLARQLTR